MLTDEYRYKLLKLFEAHPEMSQRDLANSLGVGLIGKANLCLKTLIKETSSESTVKNPSAQFSLQSSVGVSWS